MNRKAPGAKPQRIAAVAPAPRGVFGRWGLVVLASFLIRPASVPAASLPLTVAEPAAVARARGHVTSGLPFPMGTLTSDAHLRLLDERGNEVPLQTQTTATWRDGSVKWVLLDFQTEAGASEVRRFTLEHGEGAERGVPARGLQIGQDDEAITLDTGPLRFSVGKHESGLLHNVVLAASRAAAAPELKIVGPDGLRLSLALEEDGVERRARVLPPAEVTLEEAGPLRAVVKVTGWTDDGGTNRLFRYDARVHACAGSPQVRLFFTLTQLSDRFRMLWVRDLALELPLHGPGEVAATLGGQPAAHRAAVGPGRQLTLTQFGEGRYTVTQPDGRTESGFRAPGWVDISRPAGGVLVGCRHFWQQFPKALTVASNRVRLGLYPAGAAQPFDWDQGLAKTHELVLDFHAGGLAPDPCAARAAAFEHPLFAVAPAQWYCEAQVFGDLLPFDFDRFPDYETLTEASGDQFIRRMATGFRHWGDLYYGGEFKGTNAYLNTEYDLHHNLFCQFARTGLRKYLEAGLRMAGHQADIDTNHKTGWQWKHSPRHVETPAEFGHTFTRGLLEAWFLTGDRRGLETARALGDHFAREIRHPRALGNERQIGWALISLLPVYEATWDRKYLDPATTAVDRLLAGLDARGRFDIRWDNRIAFFNGIAATGFLYYHRATGDERAADAALRVIRRARGFYPEYNGRTLEAIAWACARAPEPEWFDFLQRTWETTLARQISANVMELGAPTIFTVHALPFLAQGDFLPRPEAPLRLRPDQFATDNGLYAHHLPSGEAELYLRCRAGEDFHLVIVRKGAWKAGGRATLHDPAGRPIATCDFPRENALWQRRSVAVKPDLTGVCRLALRAPHVPNEKGGACVTWDVATSRPAPAVFQTPNHRGLELVTPALFTVPRDDAVRIELDLAGEGEGFKKAVLVDPDGHVAGTVEAFINLGDKRRYHYQLAADVPPYHQRGLWQLSLQDVSVERLTGLVPCFATSRQSFFRPDKP